MTFLLAIAALAAVQAPAAQGARAADEAQLTRIKTETWPGFYRSQDADGLAAFLAEGFVNVAPDGAIASRAEELAGVRASRWEPRNFRYTIERIAWLDPDLVLIVGRGASDRTEDGRACRHSYVSSNLLRRAPGTPLGWRALSSHVSGVSCVPR